MFGDLQWISKYVAQNFAYILPIYTCTFTFAGDFGQNPKVVNFKTTFLTNFIFRPPMEKAHSCFWCGFCFSQWDLGLFFNWLYSRTLERNCGFTDGTSSWGPQVATSRTHLLATGWLNHLLKQGFPLYFSSPSFYFSNFWDEFLWIPCLINNSSNSCLNSL